MTHPTHVTIDKLKLDEKANVRKTGRGATPQFIANIAAVGVLTPLNVRPNGSGYLVKNGGKRLAAIEAIVEQKGTIKGAPAQEYPVPIYVTEESDAQARDTSLATNIIIDPMHPADRYEAFAQKMADGATEADLQTAYAMTAKEVRQVLALGALSPKVLDAWKAGKFDAEVAQAFTLASSHKLQDKALAKVLDGKSAEDLIDEPIEADEVKDQLDVTPAAIGGMVEFIGIEKYESKGGKVTPDLFGTDHKVSNEKLAKEMANEALADVCAGLVQAGWGWALIESTVRNTYNYNRMRPAEVKPTEAEQTQLLALKAKGETGFGKNRFDEQWEALDNEISSRGFTDKQKAASGCFVSLSENGVLSIDYGRVKPAEQKAAAAVDRAAAKPKPKKPGEKAPEKKPNLAISNNLTSNLSDQLTKAVAEAIATNPTVALPAVIAGFLCSAHTKPIDVSQERHKNRAPFAATFETAMKKKPADQLVMLAQVVGPLVNMNVAHTDRGPLRDAGTLAICEALGAPLYVSLKKHFDAKTYFGSVNRHIACKQLKEMFGKGYQASWENEKKAKIEKIAVTKAKETGWLPPELRTSFYAGPGKK